MRVLLSALMLSFFAFSEARAQTDDEAVASAHPGCLLGIVTITHGQIGRELVEVAQYVVGEQPALVAISVLPDDDMEERRRALVDAVQQVDAGCGVVILTDFFGGTPSNLAISVMEQDRVEVVAGLNAPMLIKTIAVRASLDAATAASTAVETGRRFSNRAADLLRRQ